jgi:hypothetical protein
MHIVPSGHVLGWHLPFTHISHLGHSVSVVHSGFATHLFNAKLKT